MTGRRQTGGESNGRTGVGRLLTAAGRALPVLLALSGCAGVAPWERQYLADPIMQLTDDGEETAYEQHMWRALAQGLTGAPVGGGGCGCEQ